MVIGWKTMLVVVLVIELGGPAVTEEAESQRK